MDKLFEGFWGDLKRAFEDIFTWILGLFEYASKWLGETLGSFAASLVEAIPVPDFIVQAQSLPALPGEIMWIADLVALDVGFPIVIAASVAKFTLRRVPIIG